MQDNEEEIKALQKTLMGSNSIAETWKVFEAFAMPKDAGDGQRDDMRISFYAGIDWLIERMITIAEEPDDVMNGFITNIRKETRSITREDRDAE